MIERRLLSWLRKLLELVEVECVEREIGVGGMEAEGLYVLAERLRAWRRYHHVMDY